MTNSIHPTAIIEDGAKIADGVAIGPYAIVGANVVLGEGVRVGAHAIVEGLTEIGANCEIFPHAVLGRRAQVLSVKEECRARLVIGERNVIREHVTMHAATPGTGHDTVIGSDCYFMFASHVGHDCIIGDKCVLANGANIGGECHVGDQVWFGGGVFVHQKTWIGDHAFVGGGCILVGDVIPFASAVGNHGELSGLNIVGLKRRGFERADLKSIRSIYRYLFISEEGTFETRLTAAKSEFSGQDYAEQVISFVEHKRYGRSLCGAA